MDKKVEHLYRQRPLDVKNSANIEPIDNQTLDIIRAREASSICTREEVSVTMVEDE